MSSIEYKRYRDFSSFPINLVVKASFQRNVNKKHIASITNYLFNCNEENKEPTLGCIELAHYRGSIFVIDGQHRLRAIQTCYKEYGIIIPIHTFNYTINTEEEVNELFKLRNMNLDVADYIRKGVPITEKEMLDFLQEEWPKIFKTGPCNRPYINIDVYAKKLKECNITNMTLDEFKDYIRKKNQECKDEIECMSDRDLWRRYKIKETMLTRFRKHDCYLGYDSNFSYLS